MIQVRAGRLCRRLGGQAIPVLRPASLPQKMNSLNPKKAASLALVLAAVALTAAACSGSDDGVTSASCSGIPSGLSPSGTGPDAYTMILRVNTGEQVDQFAASPLRSRIRDRDIFMINTEYKKMNSAQGVAIFEKLKSEFPCNRVMSLNGLLKTPGKPGYMYALAGEQGLDAILLDWEKGTWEEANRVPWSEVPKVTLKRMAKEVESVADRIAENPGAAETRVGLATQFRSGWDYAAFGRRLARINSELNDQFIGYQVVQSQDRCEGTADSASLVQLARGIRSQYRKGQISGNTSDLDSLTHLGFEISFSTKPKSGAAIAVDRDSPADGARCTAEVLKTGGAAFIYWATPAAVEAMLDTKAGKKFRPAS